MIPADPALATPASTPAPSTDARALIEDQLVMLSRLAHIGMEIAETCGGCARAAAPQSATNEPAAPQTLRDIGLVFAQVARAVRMTIALQSRLVGDRAALDRGDHLARLQARDTHRARLRKLVGQAARVVVAPHDPRDEDRDETAVEGEIDYLSAYAYERLTDAEDGDLLGRSFDEVVAAICKDLRLPPDWTARVTAAVKPPPGGPSAGAGPRQRPAPAQGLCRAEPWAPPPPTDLLAQTADVIDRARIPAPA